MKTNLCLRKQISHIVPDVVHGNMRPAVSIHTSHAFQYVSIYYLRAIIYAAAAWTTLAPPVWVISTKPRCWNLFPRRWRSHCDLSASWSVLIKSSFKTNRSCRQMVVAVAGFQREREREKKKRAGEITTAEIITASELSGLTSVTTHGRDQRRLIC